MIYINECGLNIESNLDSFIPGLKIEFNLIANRHEGGEVNITSESLTTALDQLKTYDNWNDIWLTVYFSGSNIPNLDPNRFDVYINSPNGNIVVDNSNLTIDASVVWFCLTNTISAFTVNGGNYEVNASGYIHYVPPTTPPTHPPTTTPTTPPVITHYIRPYIGNKKVSTMYVGNKAIKEAYVGNKRVYGQYTTQADPLFGINIFITNGYSDMTNQYDRVVVNNGGIVIEIFRKINNSYTSVYKFSETLIYKAGYNIYTTITNTRDLYLTFTIGNKVTLYYDRNNYPGVNRGILWYSSVGNIGGNVEGGIGNSFTFSGVNHQKVAIPSTANSLSCEVHF